MPIITISRGSGSGGQRLAKELAKKLGFEPVSREDIATDATLFGADEDSLQEALLKPPSLWTRFSHQRRRYLAFFQAALASRVKKGKVVYHGNAGNLLLPGVPHLVCVRLIAPLELRIQLLEERMGLGEEEAISYIHKVDRQREEWTRFLYGVDWEDPSLYDICVNLRTLDFSDAVDVVAVAGRSPRFQPTEESRRAMDDLVLASHVRAFLAADERTMGAEVNVHAHGGEVVLRGRLRPSSLVDAVLSVVEEVDGVERVDRSDLAAPEYTV